MTGRHHVADSINRSSAVDNEVSRLGQKEHTPGWKGPVNSHVAEDIFLFSNSTPEAEPTLAKPNEAGRSKRTVYQPEED